jgi:hypothetical protein
LNRDALDVETVSDTLGVLLKYQDDIDAIDADRTTKILEEIRGGAGHAIHVG